MAVDSRLLKQLNHKDPKQRRKAILALADCRDKAGIAPLENAAKNDPDPKLSTLANKAANHLKEQIEKAAIRAAEPERDPEQESVYVSEKDIERGRTYMDEAMSMVIAKDNAKAAKSLAKALEANPTLKTDTYFLSMVGNLFNVNGEQAIRLLLSGEARGDFIKKQAQGKVQKRQDDHTAKARELGWGSAAFDLGVFAVVAALITFFAPLVYSQLITRAADYQSELSPEKYDAETVKISRSLDAAMTDFQAEGITPLIAPALINGVVSGISLLALGFLIHQLALRVFKGHGTMPFMLSQLVPLYSLMMPVFFIWSCIVLGMISIGAGLIGLLCVPLMALASIVVFFKSAGSIGVAYDFGAAKGCLSLVFSSLALSVVGGVMSTLLFGTALNSAMSALGLM